MIQDLKTLKDIREVILDNHLTEAERKKEFMRQIENPYCFRFANIIVEVEQTKNGYSIQECLQEYIESKEGSYGILESCSLLPNLK